MSAIAEIQAKNERESQHKNQQDAPPLEERSESEHRRQSEAARTLQRTFRGHRERRQLQGLSLDPSTRWIEVQDVHHILKMPNTSLHGF